MPKLDIYLSLVSPWTYLAMCRLAPLIERHGTSDIRLYPIDLGPILAAAGGLPLPKRHPTRQNYRLVELARWRDQLNLPLILQPAHFPTDAGPAMRTAIAAREARQDIADIVGFCLACLRAVWAEGRDLGDLSVVEQLAQAHLTNAVIALANAEAHQATLNRDIERAIARGVFGAPFFFVDDEPFWGQDRLDFAVPAMGWR